jgi:hypothetical protein
VRFIANVHRLATEFPACDAPCQMSRDLRLHRPQVCRYLLAGLYVSCHALGGWEGRAGYG